MKDALFSFLAFALDPYGTAQICRELVEAQEAEQKAAGTPASPATFAKSLSW